MNRIRHSPLPALPCKALFSPLLALFLLAGTNMQGATEAAPPQQLAQLANHKAAKLLIHIERPDYPPIAKVNFIQGAVKLEIEVSEEGRVVQTHVVEGQPLLAVAAMHAVQKWRYRPYVSDKGPVPFKTNVIVKFSLHTDSFWKRFPEHPEAFLKKQVHPPKLITHPDPKPSARKVRVKVLVGSNGKVLDATMMDPGKPLKGLARKNLEAWKFQPARWGALAVPWYITVQVPLDPAPLEQDASTAKH